MKPLLSNTSSSTGDHHDGGGADISAVHGDIIRAHILTRLDGLSLASAVSASSHLRSVAAADEDRLWRNVVSTSTWPSTTNLRVQQVIDSFPGSHRGFFSDSFPVLTGHVSGLRNRANPNGPIITEELISAVDIYYKEEAVFSRVQETETVTGWFEHSPFRIDLLGPKESFRVRTGPVLEDELESELAENLKLSWILIDPARKGSVNVSSLGAVATERHWLTGEVTVKYSTVIDGFRAVEVEVKVTCRSGEMHVREVGMRVEDVEGKWMHGKGSLGILVNAMEVGERKIDKEGVKGRKRYEKYLETKRLWKEEKEMREREMGMACISVGVFVFLGFSGLMSLLL